MTLVTLGSTSVTLGARGASVPRVEADNGVLPQGDGTLEGLGLWVLVLVVAGGLPDGLELVGLLGPLF